MSHPIRFHDHTAFHVQVLRMTLAGAGIALLTYLIGLATPLNTRPASVAVWAAIAAILGLAALPPKRPGLALTLAFAAGLGLLGTLARQALAGYTPMAYPWFGVGLYGMAIGVIAGRDLRDYRRFTLPIATGLTVPLAVWVSQVFQGELRLAEHVPPFLAEPTYGAVFGFLSSVGLLARQIVIERDPVIEEYEKVKPTLSGEMKDLSERAMELYGRISQVLRDRKEKGAENEGLSKVVNNLVLKVLHLGPKWNEVEKGIGQTSAEDLTRRVEELEKKIADTSDDVARHQYGKAKDALGSQLHYLQDISRSRERVVARVHNYLATLERLHLAVINHRGADAAKFSDEVQPILDEIDTLGHEMDFASEAMREVAEVAVPAAAAEKPAEKPAEPAAVEAKPVEPAAAEATPEAEPPKQLPESTTTDPEASLAARAFEK